MEQPMGPDVGMSVVLLRRQDGSRLGVGRVERVHDDATVNLRVEWDSGNPASLLASVAHQHQPEALQHPWFAWAHGKPGAAPAPAGPNEETVLQAIESLWTANGGMAFDWSELAWRLKCGVTTLYPLVERLREAGRVAYTTQGLVLTGA